MIHKNKKLMQLLRKQILITAQKVEFTYYILVKEEIDVSIKR